MQDEPESKPLVYIPPNAKINLENNKEPPPDTKYEKRRFTLDIDAIKKLVGGLYGKRED